MNESEEPNEEPNEEPIDDSTVQNSDVAVADATTGPEKEASSESGNGSLVVKLFLALGCLAALNAIPGMGQSVATDHNFAIAIHGGAGGARSTTDEAANVARETAMKDALEIGQKILSEGGTALDAVEQVIMHLENDPQFNAGKGAVFNASGGHELDASIMDGTAKSCGAVAGVTTVKNPIGLARLVMTQTRHVLLSGDGAEIFAQEQNVEQVANDYFSTPDKRERWENFNEKSKEKKVGWNQERNGNLSAEDKMALMGTVGCVALDSNGNLAAGTSTGGMTNKKYGRVGDSPIVGAGTYADNETCAVSGTGIGEQYIRNAVAYDVAAQMKYKQKCTLQDALDDNLTNRLNENDGGLIAVDKDGNIATGTNTAGMLRGIADSEGTFEVSW